MLEVVKPGCLKAAFEGLEPCVGKLTSTVLMGLGFSNEPWLPDHLSNLQIFCGVQVIMNGFSGAISEMNEYRH